jgi:hypothetical protein
MRPTSAQTEQAREDQRNESPRAAITVYADVGLHGHEPYAPPDRVACAKSHTPAMKTDAEIGELFAPDCARRLQPTGKPAHEDQCKADRHD